MADVDGGNQQEGDGGNGAHRLFMQELALVDIIAGRIVRAIGAFAEREELVAAGREGLLDAAMRFDPTRGVPFRAYANIRIQGAVIDSIRKLARLPRRAHERLRTLEASTVTNAGAASDAFPRRPGPADETAQEDALATHLSSVTTAMLAAIASTDGFGGSSDPEADLSQDPETAAHQADLVRTLQAGILTLDADEAMMIRLSYFEGMSTRQIARELNVCDPWCFRLLRSGTMRLTKYMQAYKTIE